MPVESHTRQIIMLAWSRTLGIDDGALAAAAEGHRRLEVASEGDDARVGTFVRLYGGSVLYGPGWLLEAARDLDDEVLAFESTMIRLGADRAARSIGEAALYYADDVPEIERSESVAASFETEDAVALEALCPADDVTETGLSGLDSTVVLLPDDGAGTPTGDPLAGAGYEEWQGLIGHVGALVRPDVRRMGLGGYAAAIAMDEAFTAGLVPQWRAAMGHPASQRLADSLGFELAGSQTTVVFNQ